MVDTYSDALYKYKINFQDAPEAGIGESLIDSYHRVPPELKDQPFAELAMFLYNQLDGVPPGDLEPEMLIAWLSEHNDWAKKQKIRLMYIPA